MRRWHAERVILFATPLLQETDDVREETVILPVSMPDLIDSLD
ncbi:MAG: hypothetical protein QME92_08585 [Bacillota bacterium]|nr:hypothetical protein [Bacillota bacterium]